MVFLSTSFPISADTTHYTNYVMSAEGIHQQEVLLTIRFAELTDKGVYMIRKTYDGTTFDSVACMEVELLKSKIQVIVDHLNEEGEVSYQLSQITDQGETVISELIFVPHFSVKNDNLLGHTDKVKENVYGDPHAL